MERAAEDINLTMEECDEEYSIEIITPSKPNENDKRLFKIRYCNVSSTKFQTDVVIK